jgi:hypothetical protein
MLTLQLSALGARASAVQGNALYLPVLLLVLLCSWPVSASWPWGRSGS